MKTRKNLWMSLCAAAILTWVAALPARAQMSDNGYASVDWQYNFPVGNSFSDPSSGWGVHAEGGYYLNNHWGLGLFLAWHTNQEYIPRTVLALNPTESLSTDQQHSTFRLPFGVAGRYSWNRGGAFQPYVSVKLGAQYARLSSTFNIFEAEDKTWGFYVSPEVGLNIFPWAYGPGLHIAAYYDYGTNRGRVLTYSPDGMSNVGLRIGISF